MTTIATRERQTRAQDEGTRHTNCERVDHEGSISAASDERARRLLAARLRDGARSISSEQARMMMVVRAAAKRRDGRYATATGEDV
jgi:hypothetical protein